MAWPSPRPWSLAKHATLEVTASAGGKIDAWIDFDGNGTFDPDEHLWGGVYSQPVSPGSERAVLHAAGRHRHCRRRDLCPRPLYPGRHGLSPIGFVDNGEVVDLAVDVENPTPPAKVTGTVFDDADGGGTPDPGEGLEDVLVWVDIDGNGILELSVDATTLTDADGAYSVEDLEPGDYDVYVEVPSGFTLESDSPVLVSGLAAGECREDVNFELNDTAHDPADLEMEVLILDAVSGEVLPVVPVGTPFVVRIMAQETVAASAGFSSFAYNLAWDTGFLTNSDAELTDGAVNATAASEPAKWSIPCSSTIRPSGCTRWTKGRAAWTPVAVRLR